MQEKARLAEEEREGKIRSALLKARMTAKARHEDRKEARDKKRLEYFIDEFFIVPDRQGQGLGTRFLSAIEEAVREKGVHHLFLLTDRNTPACHFYRKAGMRVLETNVAFTKKLR